MNPETQGAMGATTAAAASRLPMLPGTFVEACGVTVFVHRSGGKAGTAPAVVLGHGIPTSSELYREIAPALAAAGLDVVAFDWPGFGRSSKSPDFPYVYSAYQDVFDELLAKLGIPKLRGLVVHDLAGPILLDWLSKNPARVERLAILNTTLYRKHWHPPKLAMMQAVPVLGAVARAFVTERYLASALKRASPGIGEEALSHYVALASKGEGRRALARVYQRMPASFREIKGVRRRIARGWKGPTRIVWGRLDPILDEGNVAAFTRDIPQASSVAIDAGHFLQEERPAEVARELAEFFT